MEYFEVPKLRPVWFIQTKKNRDLLSSTMVLRGTQGGTLSPGLVEKAYEEQHLLLTLELSSRTCVCMRGPVSV